MTKKGAEIMSSSANASAPWIPDVARYTIIGVIFLDIVMIIRNKTKISLLYLR